MRGRRIQRQRRAVGKRQYCAQCGDRSLRHSTIAASCQQAVGPGTGCDFAGLLAGCPGAGLKIGELLPVYQRRGRCLRSLFRIKAGDFSQPCNFELLCGVLLVLLQLGDAGSVLALQFSPGRTLLLSPLARFVRVNRRKAQHIGYTRLFGICRCDTDSLVLRGFFGQQPDLFALGSGGGLRLRQLAAICVDLGEAGGFLPGSSFTSGRLAGQRVSLVACERSKAIRFNPGQTLGICHRCPLFGFARGILGNEPRLTFALSGGKAVSLLRLGDAGGIFTRGLFGSGGGNLCQTLPLDYDNPLDFLGPGDARGVLTRGLFGSGKAVGLQLLQAVRFNPGQPRRFLLGGEPRVLDPASLCLGPGNPQRLFACGLLCRQLGNSPRRALGFKPCRFLARDAFGIFLRGGDHAGRLLGGFLVGLKPGYAVRFFPRSFVMRQLQGVFLRRCGHAGSVFGCALVSGKFGQHRRPVELQRLNAVVGVRHEE